MISAALSNYICLSFSPYLMKVCHLTVYTQSLSDCEQVYSGWVFFFNAHYQNATVDQHRQFLCRLQSDEGWFIMFEKLHVSRNIN